MLNKKKYEKMISDLENEKASLTEELDSRKEEAKTLRGQIYKLIIDNNDLRDKYANLQDEQEHWIAIAEGWRIRTMEAKSKLRNKKMRLKYRR